MKTESKSLVASYKANPGVAFAIVLLVVSLGAMIGAYIMVQKDAMNDQRYLQQVAELRAQAYRLTSLSRDATSGNEKAFGDLTSVIANMDSTWNKLHASDKSTLDNLKVEFDAYAAIWGRVKSNAQDIVKNKDLIVTLNSVGKALNDNLPSLQSEHSNVVEILLDSKAPADQVSEAQMQSWRAERIGRNVDKMLRGDADASVAADQFNTDANLYGRILRGMKEGDSGMRVSRVTDTSARASLDKITKLFEMALLWLSNIFYVS